MLIAEAPADAQIARELADRVLREDKDWLNAELLDEMRSWRGVDPTTTFTSWAGASKLPKAYTGFRKRVVSDYDAVAAQRVLGHLIAQALKNPTDAVIFVRDLDKREADQRKASLERVASKNKDITLRIVLALPRAKREAWVLNGFEPCSEEEKRALKAERQRLGFNPCTEAHQLDAQPDQAQKNAKRALHKLTGSAPTREAACWQDTSLDTLRKRGEKTGLKAYLDAVKKHLQLITS
ncbi:MAG: hypothetical protein AAF730_08980 [Bacteroidota bacterium]